MAYDIFISYRRIGGKELARPLKSELERRGYRVFLDFDELKDGVFDRRIMEAIDSSPIFMVVLSPHALDRCINDDDWVRREIEYALAHDRHIVPINPDLSFDGFPAELPEALKSGLGQHQFSEIMFGQLFMASVEKMVRDRIEPLLQKLGRAEIKAQHQVGALYHVETDLECRILDFGKEIALARPDTDATIRLRKGRHKLEFVSTEHSDDRLSVLFTVEDNEYEDILTIELLPARDKRLQAEAAERRRIEEERRRKREAEETARKAAEEEKRRREETARKAEEEEKHRREEASRKAEAEILNKKADKAYVDGNYVEAVKWYRKSAELGNENAQYNLGRCYDKGNGVTQDYTEAVKWYRKSAEHGYARAQNSLGNCYDCGDGVTKDYTEAVKWYRLAVAQGDILAQNNLGVCYYSGNGVTQNYTEAVKWFRKAADQGNAGAQYNLGSCYEYGQGVRRSRSEAEKWYGKAVDNGNENAKKRLAEGVSFAVGDYYNKNGKEGIVFEVDASGYHGKIVGMKQTLCQWAVDKKFGSFLNRYSPSEIEIGATDRTDGMKNMQMIMCIDGWREKYPAFAWCAEHGDGWYLPAIEELKKLKRDDSVYDAVNRALSQHGGDMMSNIEDPYGFYWSSSEKYDNRRCAWSMYMCSDYTTTFLKSIYLCVRAVSAF